MPRVAAEQVARRACCNRIVAFASCSTRTPYWRRTPRRCSGWRPTSCSAPWCCAAAIIPSLGTRLPISNAADAIALVGLFATARVFMSLAAMDVGTAFGTLGARREMLVGFLAEPALLMVIFLASLISASTALPAISRRIANPHAGAVPEPGVHRRGLPAGTARRERAHSGRQSRHAPRAHDDPRGHAARVLGASPGADGVGGGAQADQLRLHRIRLVPAVGRRHRRDAAAWLAARFAPDARAQARPRRGSLLALIETVSAKLRIFRAPEFLAHRVPVRRARRCWSTCCWSLTVNDPPARPAAR